ncbi:hypothetical protein DYB32_002997 [Aphanomyces invadans]|uniref:Uncharacterized protein n=1 Tax=Aphanomyces invadans TaxID=157072 RepID=A0A3R6ZT60_9STRA|nr:hypothetical protein DYB32_002997 [Aphanomyces invadans]
MTVQSRQYISHVDDMAGAKDQAHSQLLVEPIHIPDLKHTGIAPLASHTMSAPMFYPNGAKNVHLRHVVQDSLAHVTSCPQLRAPQLPTPNTATVTLESSTESISSGMQMTSPCKRSIEKHTKKPTTTRLHRSIHDRPNDKDTQQLLHTVRHNTTKIAALVNPHST